MIIAPLRGHALSETLSKPATPWQRVLLKFPVSHAELARRLGVHRSKISLALHDEKGLINGKDQEKLIAIAKDLNVTLKPADLLPAMK